MKQALVDKREPRARTDGLLSVSLYLDVADVQDGQADGIVAAVGIANDGEQELSVLNPYEMIQFLLVNEAGFPLQLPRKAPSLLVVSSGRGWKLDSPFPINGFLKNGQAADMADLDNQVLRFGAHDIYEARFVINRFLDAGQEIMLPDGAYRIRCIATLINADDRQESRILESPDIQVRFTRSQ